MTPARQRRQAHNDRKLLARVRHQLMTLRRPWYRHSRSPARYPKPQRFKLPRAVRKHRVRLWREFTRK